MLPFGLGVLFPQLLRLLDQAEAEHAVEVRHGGQFCGVVGLGLQRVVERGDGQRSVEVVVERVREAALQLREGGLVHLAVAGPERSDAGEELFIGRLGVVEVFPGKHQALAVMALQAEEAVGQRVIALLFQQRDREEFAAGFAHFSRSGVQVVDMHPEIAPFVAQIALRLGNFIGVVGEGVIYAAAVDVEVLAEVLHADAGALDVPTGVTHAPGGVPLQRLVLELALGEPEHEVVPVALVGVLLHALAHAHVEVVRVEVVEDVVLLELAGVEIHVAAGEIGVARVHQLLDDLYILVDAVGGGLHHVRRLDVQVRAIGKEGVRIELGDLHHALVLALGALEHLVLAGVGVRAQVADVRDVHHALDVIAQVAQVFFQHVLHDVAPQVADMRVVVHSRAAGVHLDYIGVVGDELLFGMGRGIIELHKHSSVQ